MVTPIKNGPLDKLKKVRSWSELRTRGGQAVSAYSEKFGLGSRIPTDAEFARLIDKGRFNGTPVTPDTLMQEFYLNADRSFFPAFRFDSGSADLFRGLFPGSADIFVERAENICKGRIDLLGFKGIEIGTSVDWHFEPVSKIRSANKHWKEFDELNPLESGDRKVIWELNRHQHFFCLGLAYWLTGDSKFELAFVEHLESWMAQNPPGIGINWSSSLEVAFRAMSWIWAFQFFRNAGRFTPAIFQRSIKYLYLHGKHIEKYLSTYYSPNTHLTGEALGLYYLGTQLPILERAETWRDLGESILFDEIEKQILDDGVYFEQSTWYQRYTIDFYIHFVILKSIANDEPGGAPADELERRLGSALSFLKHVTRPDGTMPIIGDDDGGRALPLTAAAPGDFRGTLDAGAELLGREELAFPGLCKSEEAFWLLGQSRNCAGKSENGEATTASAIFPNGGYCVMRDGWLDTDNYLLIDCGPVGSLAGGHGHADSLSIEVAVEGRTLLVDPGTYKYHESAESRNYYRSTASHNTLTVDKRSSSEPANTFSWRTRAASTIKSWISDQRFDYFSGEHDGYRRLEDPVTHERSVLFLRNDYMIVRDLVMARGSHRIDIGMHFAPGTTVEVNSNAASGANWDIITFGDNASIEQCETYVSSIYGSRSSTSAIRLTSNGIGTREYFTFIMPANKAHDRPTVREVPIEGARAFAAEHQGYTDVLIYNDKYRKTVGTDLFDTDFEISWARIGSDCTRPEEFVLVNGGHFVLGDRDVFAGHNPVKYAVIRRLGSELYVGTSAGRFRISIP